MNQQSIRLYFGYGCLDLGADGAVWVFLQAQSKEVFAFSKKLSFQFGDDFLLQRLVIGTSKNVTMLIFPA